VAVTLARLTRHRLPQRVDRCRPHTAAGVHTVLGHPSEWTGAGRIRLQVSTRCWAIPASGQLRRTCQSTGAVIPTPGTAIFAGPRLGRPQCMHGPANSLHAPGRPPAWDRGARAAHRTGVRPHPARRLGEARDPRGCRPRGVSHTRCPEEERADVNGRRRAGRTRRARDRSERLRTIRVGGLLLEPGSGRCGPARAACEGSQLPHPPLRRGLRRSGGRPRDSGGDGAGADRRGGGDLPAGAACGGGARDGSGC
jgi:hypothetical protein